MAGCDPGDRARQRGGRAAGRNALSQLAGALLAWYDERGRAYLPWRNDREPYRVVVSEFMLQQTQVERVIPCFERFVARFPSFAALADASQADVVREWRGLGYNSRAVRLHGLARVVRDRHGGALPRDLAALERLPGVGPYTARAIAAFAFDLDVVAIDTNVRRIVHRTQFGVEWPPRATDAELDESAAALVPAGRGYAFNSALMDLGATLCTARAPKCLLCPLQQHCVAAPLDAARLVALAVRHAPVRSPQERLSFERTTRYARGRVVDRLRELAPGERISLLDLHRELAPRLVHHDEAELLGIVRKLQHDGIVELSDETLRLRS
jgi:A/G-specific adenine glycosylase